MIFLNLREEVKIKVTVTRNGYVTHPRPKDASTHDEITTSNNTGDMLLTLCEHSNTWDAKDRQCDYYMASVWSIKNVRYVRHKTVPEFILIPNDVAENCINLYVY